MKYLKAQPADFTKPANSSGSTIRSQLLWASLFPLAFFGLLSTLVTSSALNQMMLNLVIQRNTAQVQVLANSLAQDLPRDICQQHLYSIRCCKYLNRLMEAIYL